MKKEKALFLLWTESFTTNNKAEITDNTDTFEWTWSPLASEKAARWWCFQAGVEERASLMPADPLLLDLLFPHHFTELC